MNILSNLHEFLSEKLISNSHYTHISELAVESPASGIAEKVPD